MDDDDDQDHDDDDDHDHDNDDAHGGLGSLLAVHSAEDNLVIWRLSKPASEDRSMRSFLINSHQASH